MVAKVHWIGSGNVSSSAATACGIYAWPSGVAGEYITADCRRIEAKHMNWRGVTCGRCLKNPHAPGRRLGASRIASIKTALCGQEEKNRSIPEKQ